MGNIITLHPGHAAMDEWLDMNNGLTAVFISVLALAGSDLAQTDREKELIVWLAEHDQAVVGRGTVGFAISELPWTETGFAAEQAFLLRVIESAQARTGWERLAYTPHEAWTLDALAHFHRLVRAFTPAHLDPTSYPRWLDADPACAVPAGFPRCPTHHVLLHWQGCVVCNDN
jgi:hypothetical protein